MLHAAHGAPRPSYLDLAPSDPLLSRLLALYTWFLPSLDWRFRQRVESAGVSFRNEWGRLLPDERDRAVDVLVGRWCAFKADARSLDPAQLGYQKMCRTIKVIKSTNLAATHELAHLHAWTVTLECAFPPSCAGLVERWEREVFSETGVTVAKLMRSSEAGWDAMRRGLKTAPELVEILPSADLILRQAHTASQSPADRFLIFSTSLKSLATLYRALPTHGDSLAAHDEQASLVRAVLVIAEEVDAFERLEAEQQSSVVERARDVLFEAARTGQEAGRLPSLHVLVHELREALKPNDSSSQHSQSPPFHSAASPARRPLVWFPPHTPADPPPEDDASLFAVRPAGVASAYFPESRAVHQ
ncbi:hypothetical protein JCM3775_007289 [Rhodotorula graminis]